MTNTIEIRAVRRKDWSWWYVELTGTLGCLIADGDGQAARIGSSICEITASSRRDLLRKLYRQLGVKKLNWEVCDD